ncbi:MAG: DUF1641 domain-containing protein [Bacillus sp. (in: firmicutes)]
MSEMNKLDEKIVQASEAQRKADILDQLLKPETQESLTVLVEQLPKLTEMMTVMTKSYDFVKLAATDNMLKNDTVGAVQDLIGPVKGQAKLIAQDVIEAKERAEASDETIGLFGLLKMLKDPQAQKMFRFMSAYLEVTGERENNK